MNEGRPAFAEICCAGCIQTPKGRTAQSMEKMYHINEAKEAGRTKDLAMMSKVGCRNI